MKAPEVPPLIVRTSDQSPEKIARRLSKFSRAWSEIGADAWVMRIVQWGYKIPFVTLPLSKFSRAWSEIGADAWVMRIVQWGYKIPFVTLPPLRLQGQEKTYPKRSLKWSSLNQSVQELRNKGSIEPASLTPGFYSRLFLVRKATGEWRPIIWYVLPVNQSESIYQNTQTCTSICPPPSGKFEHVHRRLVAKPRDTPESSRANILAQVPVPKARVGFKPREVGSNPFSGCHVSGDRAGHLCRPSKAITQEIDQFAIHSGGIHSTAVTTCCPVAPSTWTPSLSRETSALWSNSHSSHSMAIETPVESVEGQILKTDLTRPSVPPGHPMEDQQGQFTKGSSNRDHICGVLPVHRQQYSGLGCPLARTNYIWHLVPWSIPTTHQCPGALSHMAWPKSFQPQSGECEGCYSHVRQHVSGCLPEKSGGGGWIFVYFRVTNSLAMNDLAT